MRSVCTSHACSFQDMWKWKSARPTTSRKSWLRICFPISNQTTPLLEFCQLNNLSVSYFWWGYVRTIPDQEHTGYSDRASVHTQERLWRRDRISVTERSCTLRSLKRRVTNWIGVHTIAHSFWWRHQKLSGIVCFHMTSWRPYFCPKTIMKRRPCLCPKPVLWELKSFLM